MNITEIVSQLPSFLLHEMLQCTAPGEPQGYLVTQPASRQIPSPHRRPSFVTRPSTMLTTRRTIPWSRRGTLSDAISLPLLHYVEYRRTPVPTLPCRFPPGSRHDLQATRFEHRAGEPTVKLHNHLISIRSGPAGVIPCMCRSPAANMWTCRWYCQPHQTILTLTPDNL